MTGTASPLERGSGVALWRQIEQALAADITASRHAPGDRMPTEHELAARFAVNRHTIRRAIAALEERGLVRVEQGRGTFVREEVLDYTLGRRTRFSENLARQKRTPGGRMRFTAERPADAAIAKALGIPVGRSVTLIEMVRGANGRPVSLATHYLPTARFPGIAQAFAETRSLTRALTRYGVLDYLRRTSRITARMPTAEEATLLRQPASRPILVVESVDVDDAGVPIEYGVARFASERVQLVLEP